MRLEESIEIERPSHEIYAMVHDVEAHVQLLPGYRESRIVERKADSVIVQREADMEGVRRRWKSEIWFDEGKSLRFQQVEGPLKGMQVLWLLEPQSESSTRLSIIHDVRSEPRWNRWWTERWVYKPAIEKTAHKVLAALKFAAETKEHV